MDFKKVLKSWGPAVLWAGLIFVGSSLSAPEISKVRWVSFAVSALAHFVEFAILSFLVFRALDLMGRGSRRTMERMGELLKSMRFGMKFFLLRVFWEFFVPKKMLAAILITVIYAAADELHQYFVPTRVCSFWDFFFDSFGAVAGAVLAKLILSF